MNSWSFVVRGLALALVFSSALLAAGCSRESAANVEVK